MRPLLATPPGAPTTVKPQSRTAVPVQTAGNTAIGTARGMILLPGPPVRAINGFDPSQPTSVPQAPELPANSGPQPVSGTAARAAEPATPATRPPAAGLPAGALLSQDNAAGDVLDGLRGYRLSVASQARRFKRYPPQAMAAGWAGSTEVRLEVGSDSQPRLATVARSSGHELLDRAALAMIDAGAQRARLPESLRGRSFVVVLPVVFNLDDE